MSEGGTQFRAGVRSRLHAGRSRVRMEGPQVERTGLAPWRLMHGLLLAKTLGFLLPIARDSPPN